MPGSLSGLILTFGDCWVYSSDWFLFSCSNTCLIPHYRRAFPKCEDEPEKFTTLIPTSLYSQIAIKKNSAEVHYRVSRLSNGKGDKAYQPTYPDVGIRPSCC